ncbi:MAG: hypothetical protein KIT55_12660, partial [Nitrosomonas sp.]|nr:hypothetical protein [Nitrosomonas sp.]
MTPINTNPAAGRACGAVRLCREHADILSISHDAVDQFINAASERGLVITKPIVYDRLTRCPITGKHKNNKVGAYIFHGDGIPAGGYQNHTDGLGWQNWRAAIGRRMTHQEIIANRARIDEAKRQREIELHNKQEQAAAKAVHIWNCARPASDDFRYLIGKKIKSHGARQYKNAVVLPL